jgi:hypothetical protein
VFATISHASGTNPARQSEKLATPNLVERIEGGIVFHQNEINLRDGCRQLDKGISPSSSAAID